MAISTCASLPTEHGFIVARQSAARRSCSCSPRSCAGEGDRYVLVTPVEKVGIKVDDAPFVAVECVSRADGGRTGTDVPHQCRRSGDGRFRAPASFRARRLGGPETLCEEWGATSSGAVKRALFYDLVDLGQTEQVANEDWFGVRSRGLFFPMCPASEIEGL